MQVYSLDCPEGRCETDEWPECGESGGKGEEEGSGEQEGSVEEGEEEGSGEKGEEEGIISGQDGWGEWTYTRCQQVTVSYSNETVDCGVGGRKERQLTRRVGEGVFVQEMTSVPCADCGESSPGLWSIFTWSAWSACTAGRRSRTRGTIEASYQEEEEQCGMYHGD